jgi:beta-galactosidase
VDFNGTRLEGRLWQDDLVADSASVLARYGDGYLAEHPAILQNTVGAGTVTYLGTQLSEMGMDQVYATLLDEARVEPVIVAPNGVEAVERHKGSVTYLFLLNHGVDTTEVELPFGGTDLLAGGMVYSAGQSIELEPTAVAIVKFHRKK